MTGREAHMAAHEGQPSALAEQPRSRWMVPALGLAGFVSLLNAMALGPLLPAMAADLGVGVALLGQVPALSMLLAAVLGLVIGPLADQYGYRRMLLAGLLAIVAGTLGTGLASNYTILLLVAAVGAVGRATIQPVSISIASAHFAGEARRRAISWVTAGVSGAPIAGIPLLTTIAALLDWRAAFVGLAVVALAVTALAWGTLRPDAPRAAAPLRLAGILAAYQPLLRHRPTLGLIAAALLGSAGIWSTWTYVGAFYAEQYGFSTQAIGWVYMVTGLGVLAGNLATGGRLGRLPLRPLVIVTRLLMSLFIAAMLLLPLHAFVSVGLLTLSTVMLGTGIVATSMLLTNESPAGRATTMTLNASALSLGTAVGSSLGGLLLTLGGYPALGMGAVVLSSASGAVIWWSRQRVRAVPVSTPPPAVRV